MEQNKNEIIYKTLVCKNCGKTFTSQRYRKYCCEECQKEVGEKRYREYNLTHRNIVTPQINENSINGIDYIECPICHEKHLQLTLTHFKRHGYKTHEQIMKDFPNFKMTAQKHINDKLKGSNNPMSKQNRTELERKQSSPYSIEHYLKKYNGDKNLAEYALNNFLNRIKEKRINWNYATNKNQIAYYKSLGYIEDDATALVKTKHIANGLNHYIKKYGEELGTQKYNERIKKWCQSLRNNFLENGDGRSQQSKFAKALIELICINFNIEIPQKEKFITDTEHNKHYAFDFEYNNKLIEFNGDYWHCNPKQYKEDFYNKSKLLTAKEIWENDKLKIQCAQKNGYDVLVIWESEYNENPHNTLRKCIKFLNNEN